ncbi:glycosyltransferase family 2 protein [Planctomycetota bacterium]
MLLSVVVPVYNEEGNIPEFLRQCTAEVERITTDFEIVFAVDPGTDKTEEILLQHREEDLRIKLLRFSRRFGQPMATLAGLQYSSGDAVIVMDVDLQDPPALIPEMVERWREGFDVVLPQRRSRAGETITKRMIAYLGYKFINFIADVNIPRNTGDFRLMSRRVVTEVCRLKECHGFLRGMVSFVGFRQTSILFDRPPRHAGSGKYSPLFGSLRIGMNGVVCFSNFLLTLSTKFGFLIAIGSFLLAIVYAAMKLGGFPFPLGNPTIVILLLFLGGIQLFAVGILGEYIGRIYEEVRERPKFILDRVVGLEDEER